MYGERYQHYWKSTSSWYEYAGKTYRSKSNMQTTEYYYGNSVTYDDITRKYSIVNAKKYLWSSDYRSLKGKYTCFSNTEEVCTQISYIERVYSESAGYISMLL